MIDLHNEIFLINDFDYQNRSPSAPNEPNIYAFGCTWKKSKMVESMRRY